MTALVDLYRTDHHSLVAWICKTYGIGSNASSFMNPHRLRRETIARRLRLYRDQGAVDLCWIIDQVYETPEYQTTLKKLVPVALEQNVTRRIVDEIASLYDRPALRIFENPAVNAMFHLEEKRLRLHEIAQESHRLATLCNEVLEWQFAGIDGRTRLAIVTPDLFDAVPHPADRLTPAAFLLDVAPTTTLQGDERARLPHYEIWDDTFRYLVNGHGSLVDEGGGMASAPIEHNLGRIPGILLHRREPTTEILDSTHGADIESVHLGVGLLNIMIMRLSKSQGERQPVLSGNLAGMAGGQVMNGEKPLLLPPEVVASMLEMKTDPDHYLNVKRDKIASVAQTYGMSYEQITYSEGADAASGKVYELRREKLKEIRNEARRRSVMHEQMRAELMGFDASTMRIDYQEQAMPQDANEKLALMHEKAKMGLDSPIKYQMREDPDLSKEDARSRVRENLAEFGEVINWARALNMPANGDAGDPGKTPQENGAIRYDDDGNKIQKPPAEDATDYAAIAKEVLRGAQ